METGTVDLEKDAGNIKLYAEALLISALNTYPCGRLTEDVNACICAPVEIKNI